MFSQSMLRYVLAASALFVIVVITLASRSSSSLHVTSILSSASHGYGSRNLLDDIGNTTLGFQKLLVITMPSRTDQRDGVLLGAEASNLHVEFIDGVRGEDVPEKAYPPGSPDKPLTLKPPVLGAWRAHMDAISHPVGFSVVHNNLTSAMIMEGDVDWDVRVHEMARDFAVSSNALLKRPSATLKFKDLPTTVHDQISPYGENWDVLWLGHCGMSLPEKNEGKGRVIQRNDRTIPETQYLHGWDFKKATPLMIYPNHTRVVTFQSKGVCSLAYAVSQSGARKILYNMGLRLLDAPFDLMLKNFCEERHGNGKHTCLSAIPQIFDAYRPPGSTLGDSDMRDGKPGFRKEGLTRNIQWSVRLNMDKVLRGQTDFENQYPDKS